MVYSTRGPQPQPGSTLAVDPYTGAIVDLRTGSIIQPGPGTASPSGTQSTGGQSKSSGGGGGGGGSSEPSATIRGWFLYYYGSVPSAANTAAAQRWTEQEVINWAINNGASNTPGLNILREVIQTIAAPFYGGNVSAIPHSLIDSLIKQGYWTSDGQQYLTNQYFPALKGVGLDNPLAAGYVDAWVQMTGRPLTYTAGLKLAEMVKAYGFSEVGMAAWTAWVKTTDSAATGNWGAEHRAEITAAFTSILGRAPTAAELDKNSELWEMNAAARMEYLQGTPEYQAIYGGKPSWMSEGDWIARAQAYDAIFRNYYGDSVIMNPDGSLTIPQGQYYQEPSPYADYQGPQSYKAAAWQSLTLNQFSKDLVEYGVTIDNGKYFKNGKEITADQLEAMLPKDVYYRDADGFHYVQYSGAIDPRTGTGTTGPTKPNVVAPAWKSLTVDQFSRDLQKYGVTISGGKYYKDGVEISAAQLEAMLPSDTYWRDDSGFHYVQEEGAIDPRTNRPATGPTKPATSTTAVTGGLSNWGIGYINGDIMSGLINSNIDPGMLAQMFAWQEEAEYLKGIHGDTVTEAFGSDAGIDWYRVVSGAQGSGAMRAKLAEAENRVAYREAFRQLFGYDPDASDYDRITSEFVSPGEMLREHQALESANEMYEEINDLLMRVYGNGITIEELRDMALGRSGSGEMKALINQATKLDEYTWQHKQYYGADPTPEDYAKYAGYTSPNELQWEIVTAETIAEMRPEIDKAWAYVYPDEPGLTDQEYQTLYGEMEGYGELRHRVKDLMEKYREKKAGKDYVYGGADFAEQSYRPTDFGGFETAHLGLGDL